MTGEKVKSDDGAASSETTMFVYIVKHHKMNRFLGRKAEVKDFPLFMDSFESAVRLIADAANETRAFISEDWRVITVKMEYRS